MTSDGFKHALHQINTITSKKITHIRIWHILKEEEEHTADMWKEMDDILGQEQFKSLVEVKVACVRRDMHKYCRIPECQASEIFPLLLPKLTQRNILF